MDSFTTYHSRNTYVGNRHTRCVSKSPKYKLLTVTVVTYKLLLAFESFSYLLRCSISMRVMSFSSFVHINLTAMSVIANSKRPQNNQVVCTLNKQILPVNSTYLSGLLKARNRIKTYAVSGDR